MGKLEDLLEAAMQEGSDAKAKEALHTAGRLRAALEKAQTLDEEGGLDGQTLEDRLFNQFLVVHYGIKAPLETPRLPKSGGPDVRTRCAAAAEAALCVDVQSHMTIVAGQPEMDRQQPEAEPEPQLVEAPVFTAPLWDRRRQPGREGDGRSETDSVAGSEDTELSEAATEMPEVARESWLRRIAAKDGLEGAGDVTQKVAGCRHPPRCKRAWSVARYVDTHRPVRAGGGYRPPQDRPPPVAGS